MHKICRLRLFQQPQPVPEVKLVGNGPGSCDVTGSARKHRCQDDPAAGSLALQDNAVVLVIDGEPEPVEKAHPKQGLVAELVAL